MKDAPHARGYRMSDGTRRILRSLVPVICPPEWESLGVAEDVLREAELGLGAMPPLVRRGLAAGLWLYDVAAIPRNGCRARSLGRDRAEAHFERWRRGFGIQRELAKGARALLAMSYYELPPVLATLGYTPEEWIAKVKARRVEVYREEIAKHEASLFERDPIPLPSEVEARSGAGAEPGR